MFAEEDYRIYADVVRFRNILVHKYMMVKEEVVRSSRGGSTGVAELARIILEALPGDP